MFSLFKAESRTMTRKDFAAVATKTICPAFMFAWLDGKAKSAKEWLLDQSEDKIVQWITV